MIINTTRIGIDEAVENVISSVNIFSGLHDYIPGVRDRRKKGAARVSEKD